MGDQTLCSAFSAGGKYFVTGGSDHILRAYLCIPGPPTLQGELNGHTVCVCVCVVCMTTREPKNTATFGTSKTCPE